MTLPPPDATLSIARPLSAGLAIYLRAFLPFTAVALALALPTVLWSITVIDAPSESSVQGYRFGASLLGLVLSSLTTAILVHATFTALKGREIMLLASVRAAMRHVGPLLGASFLAAFIIVLGLALFIVPGVIAMCVLYVAIPACVVERLNPVDALKRSADLTLGHRWPVFAIALVLGAVQGGTALLLDHLQQEGALELGAFFLIGTVIQVVLAGLGAAVTTVVYYKLRQIKDRATLEQISATFE